MSPGKVVSIGVAAHVAAAASGGPRFNPTQSETDRKSATNGIWLCQNCGKLVDNDPVRFNTELLLEWKLIAERYAADRVGKPSPFDVSGAPIFFAAPERQLTSSEATLALLKQTLSAANSNHDVAITLGNGDGDHQYVVLSIPSNQGWEWDLLLFTAHELAWNPIAQTHLDGQKGLRPDVVYVPGETAALAVSHVAGYGTGVFRKSMTWYRVSKSELQPILSLPLSFYVVGWGMPFNRELRSRIVGMPYRLQTGSILMLEFTIKYWIPEHLLEGADDSLFSLTMTLTMEWDDVTKTFVPRSSTDDFSIVDDMWNEGLEDFTTRNIGLLNRLASDGNDEQKKFISKHLLPSCR